MASKFYNRYVPPVVKKKDELEQERPAKRRKKASSGPAKLLENALLLRNSGDNATSADQFEKTGLAETKTVTSNGEKLQLEEAISQIQIEEPNIVSSVKKKKKKKPKRRRGSDEGHEHPTDTDFLKTPTHGEDSNAQEEDSKHKKLRSKYENATRVTAESAKSIVNGEENEAELQQDSEDDIELHGLEPLPQPTPSENTLKVHPRSALPSWLQTPISVSSTGMTPLEDLPISDNVINYLKKQGYPTALPIQAAVLPMLLPGPKHYSGDICISAATGSGKTLAYALPMVESLRGRPITRLRGLVVVPTRELVTQAKQMLEVCNGKKGLKIGTAVGSKSLREEQGLLVQKSQRYDPEAWKAEQENEVEEDEELLNWDLDSSLGPNENLELFFHHVLEYTSKVDILVATPGRLVDHLQSTKGFSLEHIQWLVVDEADRLLDEGFQDWVDAVMPSLEYLAPQDAVKKEMLDMFRMPEKRNVQKIILSATMTRDVSRLTALKLWRPRLVVLEGQEKTTLDENPGDLDTEERIEIPPTLEEDGISIPTKDGDYKVLYLIKLLDTSSDPLLRGNAEEAQHPSNNNNNIFPAEHDPPDKSPLHGVLIFTKDNENASRLARLLELLRPTWKPRIGTLTKSSTTSSRGGRKKKSLAAFSRNELSILIASDRASRGLDIPDLAHVINYDMPNSVTSYIHRVGRTARAGKRGRATTFVEHNQGRWFWTDPAGVAKMNGGAARKVVRREWKLDVSKAERETYEAALETVGQEARGKEEVIPLSH
ncbi:ATP-dependent RNA helicase dbp6 [Mycoblastus sanguinarius]|nr:ATP-dependent RNA helicase dbp6 [Mycoblastus sanguinarius]